MNAQKKPTASVTAAGVVAIIGSVLILLGTTLVVLVLFLMPESPTGPQVPAMARNLTAGGTAFFAGLAIFGIFSGVGVLRLEKWARISVLVWSGITVMLCGCIIVFVAVMPFPTAPNALANEDVTAVVRTVTALFYGIPTGIAVWWLSLFNRKEIVAQFVAAGIGSSVDASGFPVELTSRPSLPLPITALAVFLMLSSLSVFFLFFVRMPVVLLGHALRGPAGQALFAASCLVSTAAGIGLLYRKGWSFPVTLGLQVFWFLSGLVTLLSPQYPDLMREAMSSMTFSTAPPPEFSIEQMRRISGGTLIFPVLIGVLLLYYRTRFLQASSWRKPNA